MWGADGKQEYYRAGRGLEAIRVSQIEAVCQCGYLTLKPTNDFENHCGGLTVKRSKVQIINDRTGEPLERFRPGKKVLRFGCCNACGNDWK